MLVWRVHPRGTSGARPGGGPMSEWRPEIQQAFDELKVLGDRLNHMDPTGRLREAWQTLHERRPESTVPVQDFACGCKQVDGDTLKLCAKHVKNLRRLVERGAASTPWGPWTVR
jgi:hypothetical protein